MVSPASNSAATLSPVGIYQQTLVGSGGMFIRTLVSTNISAKSYRKTLIAKLFSHQIITFFTTPSISFSDLFIKTFAFYFGINTESTEREKEAAAFSIYKAFFYVLNMQDIGFVDVSGNLWRFRILLIALWILLIFIFAL